MATIPGASTSAAAGERWELFFGFVELLPVGELDVFDAVSHALDESNALADVVRHRSARVSPRRRVRPSVSPMRARTRSVPPVTVLKIL
eukprot:18463-Rhodomonas_salina.1